MAYTTQPQLGMDFDAASSSTAAFFPGTRAIATGDDAAGSEFIYVKAAATIAAGDVVKIDKDGNATGTTTLLFDDDTTTAADSLIGVAEVAITSGEYAWVMLKGVPSSGINVAASCVKGRPLYTTSTAGRLDDATSSVHLINGIMLTATCGGSPALTAGRITGAVLARGTPGT